MTGDETACIALVSAGLLVVPPIGFLAFRALRVGAPRGLRALIPGCLATLVAVLVAAAAGFRFDAPVASCGVVMAAYGACCFLVAAAGPIPSRAGRIALRAVGLVPILAFYALATVGRPGLAWIVLDLAGPSVSAERVAPGITCETAYWGSAVSASGHALHLYEGWPLGLRREAAVFSMMETEPADPDMSCAEAFRRYRAASGR